MPALQFQPNFPPFKLLGDFNLYKGEKVLKDAKSNFQQRFHWRRRCRIGLPCKKEVKHPYTTTVNHTHITTQKQTNVTIVSSTPRNTQVIVNNYILGVIGG